jgi:hypothetical protein
MSQTSNGVAVQAGNQDEPATAEVEALFLDYFSCLEPIAHGLARRATAYVLQGDGDLAEIAQHQAAASSAFSRRYRFLTAPAQAHIAHNARAAMRLAEMRYAISATAQVSAAYAAAGVDGRLISFWTSFQFSTVPLPIAWIRSAAERWMLTDTTIIASLYHASAYWLMQLRRTKIAGLGAYLSENAAVVRAVLDRLEPASVKAMFADVVHFKALTGALLEVALDATTSSRIALAKAARTALTHADEAELYDRLKVRLASGSEADRREAAIALSQHIGAKARNVLEEVAKHESSATAKVGIDTALGLIDAVESWSATKPATIPAGHSAIVAVDGTWHLIPDPQPMPDEKPLSPVTEAVLRKAFADYNQAIDADAANQGKPPRHHHKVEPDHQDAIIGHIATGARDQDHVRLPHRFDAVCSERRGTVGGYERTEIKKLATAELTLHQAVRLAGLYSATWGNSLIHELVHSAADPRLAPLRAQIDRGADVRLAMQIYQPVDRHGEDTTPGQIVAKAFSDYYFKGTPEVLSPSMFYFYLDNVDVVEEALGDTKADGVLDFLETWPFVPASLLQVLLQFGLTGHKQSRGRARALLADTNIATLLVTRLADQDKATRYAAADWIGRRRIASAEPALRSALAGEKTDEGKATMLTALSRIGADISGAFDVTALEAEAKKGLAKVGPEQLAWFPFHDLPRLRWRNGEPVPDEVVQWWVVQATKLKNPAGNAMLDLGLDRLMPDDAAALGLLVLKTFVDTDTRAIAPADALVEAEKEADRLMTVAPWAQQQGRQKWVESYYQHFLHKQQGASEHRGMLGLSVRAPGPEAAEIVRRYLKDHGDKVNQAKALLQALARNPAPAAIQGVLAAANRLKQKTTQALARELVDAIAEDRGWTADELADRTIPDAGFGPTRELELDCGSGRLFRAFYRGNGRVDLVNADGKPVKALPEAKGEADKELVAAAKKALSSAKKEVKQVEAAQRGRLYDAMCMERTWTPDTWRTYLARHPIVGGLLQRLIWLALDAAGKTVASFRLLDDGSLSDNDENTVSLDDVAALKLAHWVLMDDADNEAWARHLADYEIAPLFAQLGKPADPITASPETTEIDARRGWTITNLKLASLCDKLGYARGDVNQDGGGFTEYVKRFTSRRLCAVLEFEGSYIGATDSENVALDTMSYRRIGPSGRSGGARMNLGEVPKVLLAETCADLVAIAAAGKGIDPDRGN